MQTRGQSVIFFVLMAWCVTSVGADEPSANPWRGAIQRLRAATVVVRATVRESNARDDRDDLVLAEEHATPVPTPMLRRRLVLSTRPDTAAAAAGFIIASDGLVVTTLSAVAAASDYTVLLSDGRSLPARRVVVDQRCQLALLKLDVANLPSLELVAEPPQMGDEVVAVSCDDEREYVAGRGMIVAVERSVANQIHDAMLVDARLGAISAGGPLGDASGAVVGVIVGAYRPDQATSYPSLRLGSPAPTPGAPIRSDGGISGVVVARESHQFAGDAPLAAAVSSTYLLALRASYRPEQEVTIQRPWLGVALKSDSHSGGVVVSEVLKESPAAAAGLQQSDIILRVDGMLVERHVDLLRTTNKHRAGERLVLEVRRGAEERQIEVVLRELPKPPGTQDSKGSRDLDVEIVQPPTLYLVPQGSANPLQVRPLITTAPAASGTVIVQRSDVEKRLEGLTRGVETLQ
ncbi:MAG: S1C family serine protease, partial [Pirellulaceae bacterium]